MKALFCVLVILGLSLQAANQDFCKNHEQTVDQKAKNTEEVSNEDFVEKDGEAADQDTVKDLEPIVDRNLAQHDIYSKNKKKR